MLTLSQIRATVSAILKKTHDVSPAIAIHAHALWTGPDRTEVEGVEYTLTLCQSDLQVREALLRSEVEKQPCILLCHFDPAHLGDDVLARLTRRRIFHPQDRDVLAELFHAGVIDSRVLACKPLVETLIHRAPREGYPPVSGGSLDLQTAWLTLLEVLFSSRWPSPSLTGILGWSLDEAKVRTFRGLHPDLRTALIEWFVRSRAEAARFMLLAMESEVGVELLPLGLLAGLLFQPECRGTPEAQGALGRLERFFQHREIDEASACSWAAAAEEFLQERSMTDRTALRSLLVTFDRLLEQTRVMPFAKFSKFSPSGLEMRFEGAGVSLTEALRSKSSSALQNALSAIERVEAHWLSLEHTVRIGRIRMALRLITWLKCVDNTGVPEGLSQLASHYLAEGGFVDWARDSLGESDPVGTLREAYQEIMRQVDQQFGLFEHAFITGLQRWCADGSPTKNILSIENVLCEVVSPVAHEHRLLLLVLDGMSVAAFRQLLDDLVRRDWVEMSHSKFGLPKPVFAVLPSVTKISRWALLAGRLDADRRSSELVEFARNPSLLEALNGKSKPQLFIKSDLTASGQLGLATDVQAAILNKKNTVVSVVVNAMDDLLSAGDQVTVSWGIDTIKPLRDLLYAARESERVVLLVSDHGHILDRTSSQVRTELADTGDRYREPTGQINDGEMEFKGRRVQHATGQPGVVCLTRRDLRYQSKKRGYHGGACLQEVVVPLAAIRHISSSTPKGWQDLPPFQPAWWDTNRLTPQTPVTPAAIPCTVPLPAPVVVSLDGQLMLPGAMAKPAQPAAHWLDVLFNCPLYRDQMRRITRMPKLAEEMPRLLRILEKHGGSILRPSLAQELNLPMFRIDGLVQGAGRVLNLDGYEVIACDRTTETVTLNLELLKSQFSIE